MPYRLATSQSHLKCAHAGHTKDYTMDFPILQSLFLCFLCRIQGILLKIQILESIEKPRPCGRGLVFALPIFPGSHPPSIVGVHELNFCVRDGNRWTLMTINTNYFITTSHETAVSTFRLSLNQFHAGFVCNFLSSSARLNLCSCFLWLTLAF